MLVPPEWPAPLHPPVLHPGEVHLWRADLDGWRARADELRPALAEEERLRAARFLVAEHEQRWVAGRAVLRALLGEHLGVRPEHVRLVYGTQGKPELAPEHGAADLRFNLSHSGAVGLYALARGRQVGVDVELRRTGIDLERIARRFFSVLEVEQLLALGPEAREQAFYRCWTCKEAYLKASGRGITTGLDRFAVSLAAGEPARLLTCEGGPSELRRWRLEALVPRAGYVGAVCAEGVWKLRCWDWPDARSDPPPPGAPCVGPGLGH
ncbi:MAG: 4'-phosphopantetheinyl transferase superfamily protein [Candidatus Latescibacterota bacterium]